MGKIYECDGVLYEEGTFSDNIIGTIEESITGKYVVDKRIGGEVCDVEVNPFTDEINVTLKTGFLGNKVSGVTITKNPFSRHGQDCVEWDNTSHTSSGYQRRQASDSSSNNAHRQHYRYRWSGTIVARKIAHTTQGALYFIAIGLLAYTAIENILPGLPGFIFDAMYAKYVYLKFVLRVKCFGI